MEGGWGVVPQFVGNADDGNPSVAIVGGGPAGMALALHRQGVTAEIFEARTRNRTRDDKRMLALSRGSRLILEWLDVWSGLPHTAISTIEVSHEGGLGRTRICAQEEKVPALGYVLSAGDLARRLDAALAGKDIAFHESVHVSAATKPRARLLAWAEGAVAATDAVRHDYGHDAVVCLATPHKPHHGTAWERFTPQGPIAALPHGNDMAIVMTCDSTQAAAAAALDEPAFLALLQQRLGRRLSFSSASPRHVVPLNLSYRTHPVGAREVWIGNAAQTLHPVGGQGFNLALRDIFELARCLTDAADPGDPALLARYAAARSTDRRAAIGVTDTLVRVFGSRNPLLRHARGAGLLALDLVPPLRSFLARRMMFGARGW